MEAFPWPSRHVLGISLLLALLVAWQGVVFAAQLTLTWTDNSGNDLGTFIERSTGTAGTYAVIGIAATGATSYTDLTITADVTYCYRVRAFNENGYSGYSNASCGSSGSSVSLAVLKTGAGGGTVTSTSSDIDCGETCSASYPAGTDVTLTAEAFSGSTFDGWSGGGCGTDSTCNVTVTANTTIIATFNPVVSSSSELQSELQTISVSSTSVQPGQSITVSFSGQAGQTQDFIALYVPGTSTDDYLDWRFLNGLTIAPSVALASGSFTFPMPLTAGAYELRWVKNWNPYAFLATSPVITSSLR
jgi:uncharacterized repeat protein (TIGR02543 family)